VVVEKIPLLALAIASCMATFLVQVKAVVALDAIPISSRIANALVSYVAYMGNFFYPMGLAVFYPLPASGLPIWKVVGSTLALTGVSVAAQAWRRRFPYLFVGWFWYVGMFVPVIGLVQVGSHSMADRYTYLPQIGLCLAVTWGVTQIAASWRYRHWVCGVASVLAVLVLMGIAWRQTSYSRDSETLFTHALACTANNYIAHSVLGNTLAGRGQVDAAIAHFQKALEIKPGWARVHSNLGILLAGRGQVDAAIAHFQKALEIEPDYPGARNRLDRALQQRGQHDRSRFIAYDNGTVLDTSSNFMWAAKDNGSDINWTNAKPYCQNYRGGGFTDWRMPTQVELEGLYDGSIKGHNGYNLTTLITLTDCCPWASEEIGSTAARFNFTNNRRRISPKTGNNGRVLPVRSVK
jgi:tetratricopeptide (TPR) repeat protein